MDSNSLDTGDQPFGRRPIYRRRPTLRRGPVNEPEGVEDTEGHVAGDQVFERRPVARRGTEPVGVADTDDTEDTEGHAVRTYPGVATDDALDCRMPLPGDEEERKRQL